MTRRAGGGRAASRAALDPAVGAALRSSFPSTVRSLQDLVRQPSVSATGEGLRECASIVAETLRRRGIPARILRLPGGRGRGRGRGKGAGAPPVVFAHLRSSSNRGAPALLFYNHYDVQPAEPLGQWRRPPFGGEHAGGRVHGRGASDDKGELMARVAAVSAMLEARGDVPCDVKFVVEGEEETGSAHIAQYLRSYRREMSCGAVVWEFGHVDAAGRPVVGLGMKGLLYAELSASGPSHDAHSSLAPALENPAWRLVGALGTLRSADGRAVAIDGWCDGAEPLDARSSELLAAEPLDARALAEGFGSRGLAGGRTPDEAKRDLASAPTCNIAGLVSGYTGEGAKTVLPARAVAKVDFRLVPGMDPRRLERLLGAHLRRRGYGDVSVRVHAAVPAWRTDPSDPFVRIVRDAAGAAHRRDPVVSVSSAGTGPMHAFATILGAPCVSVGGTHVFARIHSPNEFISTALLRRTADCMCLVMDGFAAGEGAGAARRGAGY